MTTSDRPLRALIVTDYYRPLIGGSIRSVELLARHLSQRGHTVAIATSWQPGAPAAEEIDGVWVYRVRDLSSRMRWVSEDPYKHNPPPFPDPEAAWRLRRIVKDFEPDLVHSYGWISHSMGVGLLGMKTPFLLSARDYGNFCAVGTLIRKGEELCSGPAPAKCLDCARDRYGTPKGVAAVAGVYAAGPVLRRKVTALHAVSRFVARVIDRFLHVPGESAAVIPNFHEQDAGELPDAETMARLPDRPFILFVGGFRRIKGIHELFEAYESLADPPPLVLVGTMMSDSPERFPGGVTVITDVPHATVMAIWEKALFGVLPTKAPEALGNVVHEAMSKGRAMIGTRPGGQEDMIEDGETGLLVPGGDSGALAAAMSRLIEDRDLRERIEVRARERARAFTPEVVMPQIESLYRRTIASSRGDSPVSDSNRPRSRDLAVAGSVAVLGVLVSLISPPAFLQAAILGLLVLGACGYAITAALFPPSAVTLEERIVYSFVFSIAAAALGGLELQILLKLDRDAWLGLFAGLTLLACLIALLRRLGLPIQYVPEARLRPPVGVRWAVALLAAFAVAAGAVAVAVDGVHEQQSKQRFASLWAVPVEPDDGAPGIIEVGVWNHGGPESYRLEATGGGATESRQLRLSPGQRWRGTLGLPVSTGEGPQVITLYHGSVPYRTLELDLTGAQ